MNIYFIGHDYRYEVAEFLKLFSSEFSFKEASEEFSCLKDTVKNDKENINIINVLEADEDKDFITLRTQTIVYDKGEKIYEKSISEEIDSSEYFEDGHINKKKLDSMIKTASRRIIQRSMFKYLKNSYDVHVPWGILTGIRPVKLIHSLLDKGNSESDIREYMKHNYLITDEKLDLILDIANRERKFIYPLSKDKISLYISIPFCPTRCLYCSFPSHPLKRFGDMRDEYVEKLLIEARGLAKLIKQQNKEIETLYIGGGTPTALEDYQLKTLIKGIFEIFDLSKIKEFTVEAGRPDSITREKLVALKESGVDRISINPQTFNDETLKLVGRNHNSQDIVDCFKMAREIGFDNINMDLILGLPKETPEDVEKTFEKIVSLDPESITVHTLALKRASDLKMNMEEYKEELTGYESMIKMLEISARYMKDFGYNPYYMYRQKHMLGNLENVGYAKEGHECIYNMQIMEEKQSNYAIGAGAVSKFVYLDENRIERVDDVKNVEVYIQRVDDMIEKKFREVEKNDKSSKRN